MAIVVRNIANATPFLPPSAPFVRAPEKGEFIVIGGQPHEVVRVIHLWSAGGEPTMFADVSPMPASL